MTRLLVSVRDAAEARIAVASGVDLIDIKEPFRGSLGAADPQTIAAVIEVVAGRVPVSVALGEVAEPKTIETLALNGASFAKIGLAGCVDFTDWPTRWGQALSHFQRQMAPVAVVYADHQHAKAPRSSLIVPQASRLNCAAVLLDTWDKKYGALTAHWSIEQIRTFVISVQAMGMLAVVGGSLSSENLEQIVAAGPDFIAVRGAVCRGERTETLCGEKIRSLRSQLASVSHSMLPTHADAIRDSQSKVSFA